MSNGSAKIYNSDSPVEYPRFLFSVCDASGSEGQRQSGLLIPSFGTLVRPRDTSLATRCTGCLTGARSGGGAEYYSKRGWFQRGEFRAHPSDNLRVLQLSRSRSGRAIRPGSRPARTPSSWPSGPLELSGRRKRRLSDLVRPSNRVTGVYTQAIDSEVRSQIFSRQHHKRVSLRVLAERYQNFEIL